MSNYMKQKRITLEAFAYFLSHLLPRELTFKVPLNPGASQSTFKHFNGDADALRISSFEMIQFCYFLLER